MLSKEERLARLLRNKVESLLEDYPEEVLDLVLNRPFWHSKVKTNINYRRRSDDTDGDDLGISIIFSQDGDAWVQVDSYRKNRKTGEDLPDSGSHRFRTYYGGGSSMRTRIAFMILARAIQLDQAEKPDRP